MSVASLLWHSLSQLMLVVMRSQQMSSVATRDHADYHGQGKATDSLGAGFSENKTT